MNSIQAKDVIHVANHSSYEIWSGSRFHLGLHHRSSNDCQIKAGDIIIATHRHPKLATIHPPTKLVQSVLIVNLKDRLSPMTASLALGRPLDFQVHGGSRAAVARPRREHGELNVLTYGHDKIHGELYIPTFEAIVSETVESWWQRVPLSAGRIMGGSSCGLRHCLSFILKVSSCFSMITI